MGHLHKQKIPPVVSNNKNTNSILVYIIKKIRTIRNIKTPRILCPADESTQAKKGKKNLPIISIKK